MKITKPIARLKPKETFLGINEKKQKKGVKSKTKKDAKNRKKIGR